MIRTHNREKLLETRYLREIKELHGYASLRSTENEELFSEELEFYSDKSCMPALKQQDHRLNKDELVTYRYSVMLVEVQRGVRSFAISPTVLVIFVTINVVFPREILINKNAQVFYVNFRLETNIFILFIIKHAKFWLVSKSLLVRMKNYKVGFIKVKS